MNDTVEIRYTGQRQEENRQAESGVHAVPEKKSAKNETTGKAGIFQKIRMPYYYVAPCPKCGSRMTGRFIRDHRTNDITWVIQSALRHGELVRAMPELPQYADSFCLSCDNVWFSNNGLRWFTADQIREEKRARHTIEILAAMLQRAHEEEAKKKRIPVVSDIRGFIGKI